MATLKALADETTNIKSDVVACYTNLKKNLVDQGVTVNTGDKLPILIEKTKSMSSIKIKYGSSLPITVEDGTIFMITSTPVKNIIIQEAIPALTNGDIHIASTTNSNAPGVVEYTIGSSNKKIMMYLSYAIQQVNGIPVTLSAHVGKNGVWTQFSFDEFILFDKYGYKMNLGIVEGWNKETGIWSDMGSGGVSFPNSTIYFSASTTYQGSGAYKFTSKQKIDLTPFKKITFDFFEMTMRDFCSITVGVYDTVENRLVAGKAWDYKNGYPSSGIEDIDISNINGEYSIYVNLSVNYSTNAGIKIRKIHLTS